MALLHIDGPMADRLLAQSDAEFAVDLGDRYAASGLYAQVKMDKQRYRLCT